MKYHLRTVSAVTALGLSIGMAPHLLGQQSPEPPREPSPPQEPVSPPQQQDRQQRSAPPATETQRSAPPRAATQQRVSDELPDRMVTTRQASDLEGTRVVNAGGEPIGVVDSVVVDIANGEVPFVVVESRVEGETDGDLRVVPRDAIQEVPASPDMPSEEIVRLDIDQQRWLQAPLFEPDRMDELQEGRRIREIHEFFGTEPETRFGARDTDREVSEARVRRPDERPGDAPGVGAAPGRQSQPGERAGFPEREMGAQPAERAEGPRDADQRVEGVEPPAQQRQARAQQQAGAGQQRQAQAQQRQDPQFVRSTDVSEQQLAGADGEAIGQVQDFVFDPRTGRVSWVTVRPDSEFEQRQGEVFGVSPHSLLRSEEGDISVRLNREQVRQAQRLQGADMQSRAQRFADDPRSAREQPEIFRFEQDDVSEFGAPARERADPQQPDDPAVTEPAEPAEPAEPRRGQSADPADPAEPADPATPDSDASADPQGPGGQSGGSGGQSGETGGRSGGSGGQSGGSGGRGAGGTR